MHYVSNPHRIVSQEIDSADAGFPCGSYKATLGALGTPGEFVFEP